MWVVLQWQPYKCTSGRQCPPLRTYSPPVACPLLATNLPRRMCPLQTTRHQQTQAVLSHHSRVAVVAAASAALLQAQAVLHGALFRPVVRPQALRHLAPLRQARRPRALLPRVLHHQAPLHRQALLQAHLRQVLLHRALRPQVLLRAVRAGSNTEGCLYYCLIREFSCLVTS